MRCLYEIGTTGKIKEVKSGRSLAVLLCVHKEVNGEVTRDDCATCEYRTLPDSPNGKKAIVLVNKLCPGDIVVLTAAIRSLHLAYPNQYEVFTDTYYPAVFDNSPDVVATASSEIPQDAQRIEISYPLINESNMVNYHFMHAYVKDLREKIERPFDLMTNRPHLYLSDEEKSEKILERFGIKKPFFVMNAGFKDDYPTKYWGHQNYQELVDRCRGIVPFVQVGDRNAHHPILNGVYHALHKTTLRELFALCWHAEGGVGPSTLIQHVFAALQKPYVCLLGGREPLPWVTYPLQTTMHTLGALSCCSQGACWKAAVNQDKENACLFPMPMSWPVPKCMTMITPKQVTQVIANLCRK